MQVQKKYKQLINFIKVFNKYTDANTLVNISEDDYNLLMQFATAIYNIDPNNTDIDTGGNSTFDPTILEDYATKEYVNEKISNVVGAAPETLDTLKEIADWIGEHGGITIPSNVVTSNVDNMKIDVVGIMPETPAENTLYVVQ